MGFSIRLSKISFGQLFGSRFKFGFTSSTRRLSFGNTSARPRLLRNLPLSVFVQIYFSQFLSMAALSLLLAGTYPVNGSVVAVINRAFFGSGFIQIIS